MWAGTEGGECGGTERAEAEAYGGEGAGGESWEAGAECGGAEAGEEGSQVSGVAGSGGEEGMEAEEYFSEHGAIMETPSGYCQQVPQVSIAQTYLKIMNRFCEQFGLTPSSRSRIVADAGEDKESDVMEILLFKGGGG